VCVEGPVRQGRLSIITLALAIAVGIVPMLTPTHAQSGSAPSALPLIGPSGLTYLGTFRVPGLDPAGVDLSFGRLLGLGPRGDSLWWLSQVGGQLVAEVSIAPIGGFATVLQRARDVFDGRRGLISPGAGDITVGGILSWNGRLVASGYAAYDANGLAVTSHVASGANLAITGDVVGPVRVGTDVPVGMTAGYMGLIPAEWRAAFGGAVVTGQCCISISWRTSNGPALFVFNPDDIGRVSPVPAQALLYYPLGNGLGPNNLQNPVYNDTTTMAGMAFPAGTRSVLFFGSHGLGSYCYGTGGSSGGLCVDPAAASNGPHAYPYIHQVWAYDALDLLRVHRGEVAPWAPRPYATWRLSEMNDRGSAAVAGLAYDSATKRVYMAQPNVPGDQIVHVYQIGDGSFRPPPTPVAGPPGSPTNLTATVSGSRVELSWQPPVDGEPSSYILEGGTSSGNPTYQQPVSDQFLRVDNVLPGRYFVRVRAVNDSGTGAPSAEVIVDVGGCQDLTASRDLSSSVEGSMVTISWSGPSCDDVRYEVSIGSAPGASDVARFTTTERVLRGPGSPGVYFVRVTAVSSSGMRATSEEIRVSLETTGCTPLPDLALNSEVNEFVGLDWTPSSAVGADVSYLVEIGSSPGASDRVQQNVGLLTRFAANLKAGTYYARVRVKDRCGAVAVSNEALVQVP
jgi:hypothetical protein